MSAFRLQIVDTQGRLAATWKPGDAAEIDLVQRIADRVTAKPVGVFHTAASVRRHVIAAAQEVLHELKATVKPT